MAIDANVFEMNMKQIAITCDSSNEQIEMALKVFNGRLLEAKKEQA